MNLVFLEDFKSHDEHFHSYQMEVERSSDFIHQHAEIKENHYSLLCPGNKHFCRMPDLLNFRFTTFFSYSPDFLSCAEWMVFFQYDRVTRCGMALAVEYCPESFGACLKIKLKQIRENHEILCHETSFDSTEMTIGTEYELSFSCSGKSLRGECAGKKFEFSLPDSVRGAVGIGRRTFVGEVMFREIRIESDDPLPVSCVLPPVTVEMPDRNGGGIPYRMTLSMDRFENGPCRLNVRFEGGMWDRKYQKNLLRGQYSAECDRFQNLYLRVCDGAESEIFYLKNGLLAVIDCNVHWPFLRTFFGTENQELQRSFYLKHTPDLKRTSFVLGYDFLKCKGFKVQSGGPTEFVYDATGRLLYSGEALNRETIACEVRSNPEKEVAKRIPNDLPDYEKALKHAQCGHYFMEGEAVWFDLEFFADESIYDPRYWSVSATLQNVYHETLSSGGVRCSELRKTGEIKSPACSVFSCRADLGDRTFQTGVYRILFSIRYGEREIRSMDVVFEVLSDTDRIAPPLASGLPFLYSTPNEDRFLSRDYTDPWNPMPSCNAEHYFCCSAFTPKIGQDKQVWRALAVYHREWFAWLDQRTEVEWDYRNFMEVVKHADYLYYPVPGTVGSRFDLWKPESYTGSLMEDLKEFFAEQDSVPADIAAVLEGKTPPGNSLIKKLVEEYGREWIPFFSHRLYERRIRQKEELLALNPKLKHSSYGPWPVYVSHYRTYHFMRWFGYLPELGMREFCDGFQQFEDYPFSCAYQTYNGAWGILSYRLFFPGVKVYPELYDESDGGCPDGAVAYAYPPLGKRRSPLYIQTQQMYEYAYATASRRHGAWDFWRDYGFMMRDARPQAVETFVQEWKHVHHHPPRRPLTPLAYVLDLDPEEDRFNADYLEIHGWGDLYNRSEEGLGYVNETARMAGIPAGFGIRFEDLDGIPREDLNVLVLPSLKNIAQRHKEKVIQLYKDGVKLIAVGDVSGMESLFGVVPNPRKKKVRTVRNASGLESVQPLEIELLYDAANADVLLETGEGDPLLIRRGNLLLFNVDPAQVGRCSFLELVAYGRGGISERMRSAVQEVLLELCGAAPVRARGGGSIAFEDENGEICVVLLDYSPYDEHVVFSGKTVVTVTVGIPGVRRVECENPDLNLLRGTDGTLEAFSVVLRPHETAFAVLKKD